MGTKKMSWPVFKWQHLKGQRSSQGCRVMSPFGGVAVQAGVWRNTGERWSWAVHDPSRRSPTMAQGSGARTRKQARAYAEAVMRVKLGVQTTT